MMKASINRLRFSVKGIYKVYNPSSEELKSLREHFGNKVQGGNGIYTISENVNRRVLLEVFVHEMWTPVKIDIYDDISKLLHNTEISEKIVEKLSNQLKGSHLYVKYDWINNSWSIENLDAFLKLVKKIIAE